MTAFVMAALGCGPRVADGDGSASGTTGAGQTHTTQPTADVGSDATGTTGGASSADDTSGTTGFPDVPWQGWSIIGESTAPPESIGNVYAGVGDMDGDGLGDFLVGAPTMDGAGAGSGRVYFVRGRTDREDVQLDDVAENVGGFVIPGESAGDGFGYCVAPAGDFNADGVPDAIIGAPFAESGWGRAYVLFGSPGLQSASLATLAADGAGFSVRGEATEDQIEANVGLGGSVDLAFDINGDSFDDVIMSSARIGRVYVLAGGEALGDVSAAMIGAPLRGGVVGLGYAGTPSDVVRGAGDHDGDGFGDVLASKSWFNDVYFGGADWLDPDRTVGYSVEDYYASNDLPTSSCAVQDFTGDGRADVAVASTWPTEGVSIVHGTQDRAGVGVPSGAQQAGRALTIMTGFLETPPDSTGDRDDWPPGWSPYLPELMDIGDVDGDGRDDIAVQIRVEEPADWIGASPLVGNAVWLIVYGTDETGILDGADVVSPAGAEYGFAVTRKALVGPGCRHPADDLDGDGLVDIAFPAPATAPSGAIDIRPSGAR